MNQILLYILFRATNFKLRIYKIQVVVSNSNKCDSWGYSNKAAKSHVLGKCISEYSPQEDWTEGEDDRTKGAEKEKH